MQKECARCHEKKELNTTYFPHNSKSKDGFDGRCKACWKLISQEKTRKKHSGEGGDRVAREQKVTQDKVRANAKVKAYDLVRKPKAEVVPNDVQIVPVQRYTDLPKDTTFWVTDDTLTEAIESYVKKFGVRPQVVFTPAKFYLELPADQDKAKLNKVDTVGTKADKPAKAGKKIRRK
jgi:hypothetical protein